MQSNYQLRIMMVCPVSKITLHSLVYRHFGSVKLV
jgi:hypothetical protein